ncbi:hypothetical protein GCM10011609_54820 [Lentzea pudingi]|uniref:Alpha-galactosidase n=2 Tax=Lentzea pudingi TaxID=1789439 RepID=A0ABQ2IFG4_9PSEU|nr:hypothetical protein GCM10011609_54820 [Lentzea pudingi]
MLTFTRLLIAALFLSSVTAIGAPTASAAPVISQNQVKVPAAPMGWASWNTFFENIDHNVIKAQADALVSSGLAAAGYRYVNIDSGWWKGTRDSAGEITVDEAQWPGGMKAIADYIHGKGLKAGIYTDAGKNGCGYYFPTPGPPHAGTGSEGHYEQDMLKFSRWGFDYVKVDWCGADVEKLDAPSTYRALSDAVTKASATTGRELVLSICEWGKNDPWNWAPGMAPLWRTGTDIIFAHETPSIGMVYENFDKNQRPTAQHTGYYNDPDMMMIGMPGLSAAASRVHMSLWAAGGSPMLLGNDLTKVDDRAISVLTNREVLAVGQDPRGLPAVEVAEDVRDQQVYAKVLSGNGRRAVVLLNRTSAAATMTVRLADLGLSGRTAAARDLWTGTSTPITTGSHRVSVPAGDAVMLTIAGTEAAAATYAVENSRASGITATTAGLAVATFDYTNGDRTARQATLQVNGSQMPTALALPPTARGTVSAIVSLAKGTNSLTVRGSGVTAVEVRALPGTAGTQLAGTQSGRCADINRNTATNGTQAQLWDCNGGEQQTFTHTARKELVVYGNKCLDAWDHGTTNGTKVTIYDCTGGTNQQWNLNPDGTITGVQSGLCLDAYNAGTANGTPLVLWTCNGAANQKWNHAGALATGGSFEVLTYNVAGLPEPLSSGDPAVNTPLISPRLAPYDVVTVQEDFNYHAALYAGDNHAHRTPTSGGVPFGSVLNTLSHKPYSDLERTKWSSCNGTDCLTPKGFTFQRITLADGVHVDLYNLHPNAGTETADLAARRSNITQLSRQIAANSAGNAVIVMGDTNTRYTRVDDNIRELVTTNGLTDAWVQLERGGQAPAAGSPALVCDPAALTDSCEVVDKILYRGNRQITLTARDYRNDNAAFLDARGKPLSDHYPIATRFDWSADDGIRLSAEFGGPHGTPFTDLAAVDLGPIRTLTLRGGSRLDQVSATFADGTTLTHGGSGGTAGTLTLDAGEHFVAAKLSQGKHNGRTRVFSAALTTNRGRVVSAGQETGETTTVNAPAGWRIAGFTGRAGGEVDRLGAIFAPA